MTYPIALRVLPDAYTIHRLPADAPLPELAMNEPLQALLRSPDELSLVCRSSLSVPGSREEPGWRCLVVKGPLNFDLTGIVARLTAPLAAEAVPVFVVSSFDTDYVLVKGRDLLRGLEALKRAGIAVEGEAHGDAESQASRLP